MLAILLTTNESIELINKRCTSLHLFCSMIFNVVFLKKKTHVSMSQNVTNTCVQRNRENPNTIWYKEMKKAKEKRKRYAHVMEFQHELKYTCGYVCVCGVGSNI